MNRTQLKSIALLAVLTALTLFLILFFVRATVPVLVDFSETVAGLPELAAALVALAAFLWILKNI